MISYGRQTIDQSDIDAVIDVLKSDYLTQGPAVETFEKSLLEKFGPGFCSVVSNGTAALHITGLALGWSENDIIIMSPLTFLATSNSVLYCGATPDFCDINREDYTIDLNKLEKKIKSYEQKGKKVKAVIGVDFAGHPCDWSSLRAIADKYNLQLVNDNCHAAGASYKGKINYALNYADVVTHSYHPVKPLTTGEGGAIFTKDKGLDSQIKKLRSHGMVKDENKMKEKGTWFYEMRSLGFNYRLSDIHAALGISQLKKLEEFTIKRNSIAAIYHDSLKNKLNMTLPLASADVSHSYHLYPLLIDFEKENLNKVEFFFEMKKKGINLQAHYIPIHLQPFYKQRFNYKAGDFPVAEDFYNKEVSLPIFPSLLSEEQEHVLKSLDELLK